MNIEQDIREIEPNTVINVLKYCVKQSHKHFFLKIGIFILSNEMIDTKEANFLL